MRVKLGMNLGFAINRYIEPEVWTRIVAEELGVRHVQFVADLLNPFLPSEYVDGQVNRIVKSTAEYGIQVESIFTSGFTRVNHLMHPDSEARQIWLEWFKRFFSIGSRMGATSGGSHFGILTFDTLDNPSKREHLIAEGVRGWQELSYFAKDLGYECLIFEPMSVPREMANTVGETRHLMGLVNQDSGVPMKVCLDIGHAPHPSERDPYFWIEQLALDAPVIHLQQTELHRSHHWPFTPEYNKAGIIDPQRVLQILDRAGAGEVFLAFEISHREHWDTDCRVISDLKASVDYWRHYTRQYEEAV